MIELGIGEYKVRRDPEERIAWWEDFSELLSVLGSYLEDFMCEQLVERKFAFFGKEPRPEDIDAPMVRKMMYTVRDMEEIAKAHISDIEQSLDEYTDKEAVNS